MTGSLNYAKQVPVFVTVKVGTRMITCTHVVTDAGEMAIWT